MKKYTNIIILVILVVGVFAYLTWTPDVKDVDPNNLPQELELAVGEIQTMILNQGAEPRQLLRYNLKSGDQQTATMRMLMNMKITMGAEALPTAPMPWIRAKVSAEVGQEQEGYYLVNASFGPYEVEENAEVAPSIVEALRAQFAEVGVGTCQYYINSLGKIKEMSCKVEGQSPQMSEMMGQLTQSLKQSIFQMPEEPLGVGAEFVQRTKMNLNMLIDQSTTYKISAINEGEVMLDIKVIQKADPQKISNSQLPEGSELNLVEHSSNGGGRSQVFLSQKLFPISEVTMSSASKMLLKEKADSPEVNMQYNIEMVIKLE